MDDSMEKVTLLRRKMVYILPDVVVIWGLIKVATIAAALAILKRRAVNKQAIKHGQPPRYLCWMNYVSKQ